MQNQAFVEPKLTVSKQAQRRLSEEAGKGGLEEKGLTQPLDKGKKYSWTNKLVLQWINLICFH